MCYSVHNTRHDRDRATPDGRTSLLGVRRSISAFTAPHSSPCGDATTCVLNFTKAGPMVSRSTFTHVCVCRCICVCVRAVWYTPVPRSLALSRQPAGGHPPVAKTAARGDLSYHRRVMRQMCSLPRPWTSKAQHGIPKWDSSANPYEETCKARRPRTPQHTTHQFVAVHLQGEPRTKTRPRIPLSPITASKKDADEELIVLRDIDQREFHLSRLHELIVAGLDGGKQPELDVKHVASLRAQLAFVPVACTPRCCRGGHRALATPPADDEPFVWRSHNYLRRCSLTSSSWGPLDGHGRGDGPLLVAHVCQ